jgi:hypothetical protein
MRSFLLGAAVALGFAPAIASATVQLNFEQQTLPVTVTKGVTNADQVVFLESYATDVDNTDERLNAYTIALTGTGNGFGDPAGVRFKVPTGTNFGAAGKPVNHPYVFGLLDPVPPVENFSSTPGRLQFGATAINQEDEVNVGPGRDGLIRVPITVPFNLNLPAGTYNYTINFVPSAASLAGLGDPIAIAPTGGTPGTFSVVVIDVPEPASMGLIGLGGLLTLRRRRVA